MAAGGRERHGPGSPSSATSPCRGQLVHDETTHDLDQAVGLAQVRLAPTGLFLVARGPTHLVRAAVWAVAAAHKPAPVPAIH